MAQSNIDQVRQVTLQNVFVPWEGKGGLRVDLVVYSSGEGGLSINVYCTFDLGSNQKYGSTTTYQPT